MTISFIHEFEKTGRVAPLRWKSRDFDALASIRAALEEAGIEFTNGEQPGVRQPRLMTEEVSLPITPYQMRRARLILGWSRQSLSNASNTSVSFIQGYEELGRVGRLNLRNLGFDGLAAIRSTLEAAGIIFADGGKPGVKLKRQPA